MKDIYLYFSLMMSFFWLDISTRPTLHNKLGNKSLNIHLLKDIREELSILFLKCLV